MMNADIQWQDYEELVKEIYEALGKAHGVTIECWGANCRRARQVWRNLSNRPADVAHRWCTSIPNGY